MMASFSLLVLWIHSPFQPFDSLSFGSNQRKGCSCGRMEFPRRSETEDSSYRAAWERTVQYVISRKLTFLDVEVLTFHRDVLHEIESKGIPGMIFECGVAKAGSSITFASYKHPKRCLHLFDTFEGIPEPSSKDGPDVLQRYMEIKADKLNCQKGLPNCNKEYYGNLDNLLAYDKSQFEMAGFPSSQNAVYFHKGLFDDTVWPAGPIAYAHLDGDWYDSTYHMLERLTPYLSESGYFVLDDVYTWSGAQSAYSDYFQVNLEWLKISNPEKQCWTVVTLKNHPSQQQQQKQQQQQQQILQQRYFRVALNVRAIAQIFLSLDDLRKDRSDMPQCIFEYSPSPAPQPTEE